MVNFRVDGQVCLNFGFDKSNAEPCDKVKNFNTADEGEPGEKPHGASNQTELVLKLDLLVSHDLVVGGSVKEYVDKFNG